MGAPELAPLPLAVRVRELMDAAGAPASAQAVRAAESLRDLMRWSVTAEVDEPVWAGLADELVALRARLPECDTRTRYARAGAGEGAIAARSGFSPNVRGTHPLVGRANPV